MIKKDLIQDIKRPKKSLEDILPKTKTSPKKSTEILSHRKSDNFFSEESEILFPDQRSSKRRWFFVFLLIVVIFLAGGYFWSVFWGQAVVTVSVKRVPLTVNGSYRAISLPANSEANFSQDALGFQTMTIKANESATLPAGEKVSVSEKAKGEILIVNQYSQNSQKLLANTRFESPEGRIYRIEKAVVVPGYTLKGGKISPGEVAVLAIADKPGSDYNGNVPALTIPGFKGDDRFDKIIGIGQGSFSGGFVGERRLLSDADLVKAEAKLTSQLKERLLAEAAGQVIDDYVWYPESVFWSGATTNVSDHLSGGLVEINRRLELVAPIFSRSDLSLVLANKLINDFDGLAVDFSDLGRLTFKYLGEAIDPRTAKEFSFNLIGSGEMVWKLNQSSLSADLAGKEASDYQSVFLKYPGIISSKTVFSPPWLRRFPKDLDRIIIESTDQSLVSNELPLTSDSSSARIPDTTNQRDMTNGN